jgi:hypothetical protein
MLTNSNSAFAITRCAQQQPWYFPCTSRQCNLQPNGSSSSTGQLCCRDSSKHHQHHLPLHYCTPSTPTPPHPLQIHEFNPFLRRCNPDVCHSYALSAFRVHSNSHQDSSPCQYGSLPGVLSFNVMKPAGSRWQTAVPNCQLHNLLMSSAQMGHVKVLVRRDKSM